MQEQGQEQGKTAARDKAPIALRLRRGGGEWMECEGKCLADTHTLSLSLSVIARWMDGWAFVADPYLCRVTRPSRDFPFFSFFLSCQGLAGLVCAWIYNTDTKGARWRMPRRGHVTYCVHRRDIAKQSLSAHRPTDRPLRLGLAAVLVCSAASWPRPILAR